MFFFVSQAKRKGKMMRSRLLWFILGFSVSGAAFSQFVWRDLLTDRYALSSDLSSKFEDLEARVRNLETVLPSQVEVEESSTTVAVVD